MVFQPITACDICGPVQPGEKVYSGVTGLGDGTWCNYDLCETHYFN